MSYFFSLPAAGRPSCLTLTWWGRFGLFSQGKFPSPEGVRRPASGLWLGQGIAQKAQVLGLVQLRTMVCPPRKGAFPLVWATREMQLHPGLHFSSPFRLFLPDSQTSRVISAPKGRVPPLGLPSFLTPPFSLRKPGAGSRSIPPGGLSRFRGGTRRALPWPGRSWRPAGPRQREETVTHRR